VPDALPLPMSRTEMEARGWEEVDIVFVSGDAYVDHPSFAMAILARVLESAGFRVGMLCQPDWHSADPWRTFEARRQRADHEVRGGEYVHQIPGEQPEPPRPTASDYRPHRKDARRRERSEPETQ
jgi:hypothetical protein